MISAPPGGHFFKCGMDNTNFTQILGVVASNHPPADYMVHKVLIPEFTLGLIEEDFKINISDPHKMEKLLASPDFGQAMFKDIED
ncbi:hypothetical protein VP01_858g3 [Puccinia sorghi]|uniref:Restriction of telomere capping protein 4 C-terminal domain-containing protein n=1 Tax=Puccinia sorghi TaxID=27349 RepID=A0A0L6U8Y2_9BASI|nr:hypothetical protein VP01_858g3 [Puccinia sorghi]